MSKQQSELTLNVIKSLNKFDLTATAKLVLVYLTTFNKQDNKEFSLKQKRIIKTLGISERSVSRAMVELYAKDIVKKKPGFKNYYSFSTNFLSDKKKANKTVQKEKIVPVSVKQLSSKQGIHIYIESIG